MVHQWDIDYICLPAKKTNLSIDASDYSMIRKREDIYNLTLVINYKLTLALTIYRDKKKENPDCGPITFFFFENGFNE